MTITENSKMPKTFKERFLVTAKNKKEILEMLTENKNIVLKTLNKKKDTWFLCKLPLTKRQNKT